MKSFLKTSVGILLSWRFLLNLAVILVITCWVPLLSQTMVMKDSNGKVLQEKTTVTRVYQSWGKVLQRSPGMGSHVRAVATHFGMCLAISFAVWYVNLLLRDRKTKAIVAEGPDVPDAPDGEAPGP